MKNVKAERISVKEYIKQYLKPGFKAFAETFATLGDILVGTSNESKLTEAEIEAQKIWESNPKSKNAVEKLEERETIPEKGTINKSTKKNKAGTKGNFTQELSDKEKRQQMTGQVSHKEIEKEQKGAKAKEDDYVK